MLDLEAEPKVVRVTGDDVRKVILRHMDQCRKAIASFELALKHKRTGGDWLYAIDKTTELVKTAELVLPFVSDGPFEMSCSQWIRLVNKFADVMDADGAVAYFARKQAEEMARATPAGVDQ